MHTPFPVGKPVRGNELVGREKEIKEIIELLKDGQSIVLIAPRRFGKTSVILDVLEKFKKQNLFIGDVDIFNVLSKRELAEKIVETTLKNRYSPVKKLMQTVKTNLTQAIKNVNFKAVIDKFEFILNFADKNINEDSLLDEALDFPEKFAKAQKKNIIIAFDEFSDITKLDGMQLLKKMRARFQRHQNVAYIFSGSQESLMKKLFLGKTGAFFRFGRVLNLGLIDKINFQKYIKNKFTDLNLLIENETITRILNRTDGHPYYTQLLCQIIYYSVKGKRKRIIQEDVEESYERVLLLERSRFDEIWFELFRKKNYLKTMRAIAYGDNPYNVAQLTRQNINRILNSLEDSGYILRVEKGIFKLTDTFFREYIVRKE